MGPRSPVHVEGRGLRDTFVSLFEQRLSRIIFLSKSPEGAATDIKLKKKMNRASIFWKVQTKKVSSSHLFGTTLRSYRGC